MWRYLVNLIAVVFAVAILYNILGSIGTPLEGFIGSLWSMMILTLVVILAIYVVVKRFRKLF
jgi:uncharacterized membrane protein